MPTAVLRAWLRVQAVGWLAWLVATAMTGTERPAAWGTVQIAAMTVSFASLVVLLRAFRRVADGVTIVRFGILVGAVGLADAGAEYAWPAALAAVTGAALDLADGAAARRWGGSPEGAVLDMETDQLTVLALATMVVWAGGGVHALILPALRHAFVLAMWWAGAPAHEPKPIDGDNRRGRRVCAAVVCALLLALWPPLPRAATDAATLLAVLLLAWSFAGDTKYLLARRAVVKERA